MKIKVCTIVASRWSKLGIYLRAREIKNRFEGEMGLIVTISGGWRKCEALWNRESVFNDTDIARSRSGFLNRRHAKFPSWHEFISSCLQPIYIRRDSGARCWKNVRSPIASTLLTKDIKLPTWLWLRHFVVTILLVTSY